MDKLNGLAATLKNLGIVSSVSDAIRLADNITSTEQKLAKSYGKVTPAQGKTKSYQEEIDELIRKTSPEYKQYHIPVKGYKREEQYQENESNKVLKTMGLNPETLTNNNVIKKQEYNEVEKKVEKNKVFYELEESKEKLINKNEVNFVLVNTEKDILTNKNSENTFSEKNYKDIKTEAKLNKEVYTDLSYGEQILNEIVNMPISEKEEVISLSNSNLVEKKEDLMTETEEKISLSINEKEENDFIIEIKDLEKELDNKIEFNKINNEKLNSELAVNNSIESREKNIKQSEQLKEVASQTQKRPEPKNKIEDVDIFSYFKAK